mgnify:CR=1 FL=1
MKENEGGAAMPLLLPKPKLLSLKLLVPPLEVLLPADCAALLFASAFFCNRANCFTEGTKRE